MWLPGTPLGTPGSYMGSLHPDCRQPEFTPIFTRGVIVETDNDSGHVLILPDKQFCDSVSRGCLEHHLERLAPLWNPHIRTSHSRSSPGLSPGKYLLRVTNNRHISCSNMGVCPTTSRSRAKQYKSRHPLVALCANIRKYRPPIRPLNYI